MSQSDLIAGGTNITFLQHLHLPDSLTRRVAATILRCLRVSPLLTMLPSATILLLLPTFHTEMGQRAEAGT
jgi:hypothetical protein